MRFFQLTRIGPLIHILAGLVPLAWIHMGRNNGFLPEIGLILFCGLLALLPDIDTSTSTLGRFVPEISRYIERHYGHRSITHSLTANAVVGAFAWLLAPDWLALTLAYTSHLIIDMIVGGNAGVPLLWPAPWRFKLMHVVPASRGELVTGALTLALLILPFTAPGAAVEVRSIIPSQPTPTPTKTAEPPTPTATPAPTLIAVQINNVHDIETEILVKVGDRITVGQPLADLHTVRLQLISEIPATSTPIQLSSDVGRNAPPNRSFATIQTNTINIRSGPGLNHEILGNANRGAVFTVLQNNGPWIEIQYNGQSAWLFRDLVTLSGQNGQPAAANPNPVAVGRPFIDPPTPTPVPINPLVIANAQAALELARSVATAAFLPPDPEGYSNCVSQVEGMRNALWQAQLARDATKIKANDGGIPWEQIGAMEAGLFERERQIAEKELECAALGNQQYALDENDRQIAAARLQQAEITYLQRIATSTPRPPTSTPLPTGTATPTKTPTPTKTLTSTPVPTPVPTLDFRDTYIASLIAGDVYDIKIVRVSGNVATVEIQIATGYSLPDVLPEPTIPGSGAVVASGSISAAFTLDGIDIERMLIERIDAAESTIDVAAFALNLDGVADAAIEAKNRGVAVRWVTDDEYGIGEDQEPGHGQFARMIGAGIEVRDDDRSALMHNKFVIVDGASVWTGSTNITENGTRRNNNNVIIFDAAAVAEIYQREFDEMWAGQFGPGSPSQVAAQAVELDGVPIQVLFGPEDGAADHIVDLVSGAEESIRFMAFSFTHDGIGSAMQEAAQLVNVAGIFETRGSNTEYSELSRLHCESAADVRTDGNPATMHHKTIVIDEWITITGSFNFSANANERNDENVVVIYDEVIAAAYLGEFERRWVEADAVGGCR